MITIDEDDLDMDQVLAIKRESIEFAQRECAGPATISGSLSSFTDVIERAKKYEKFFLGQE